MKNCQNTDFVSNNIIKKIKNPDKINIMKLLDCDEKYIDGRASDFEWFAMWEELLFLAEGHSEVEKYREELASLGLPMPQGQTCSRDDSISRWRRMNIENNTGVFEGDRQNICGEHCSDIINEKYKKTRDCLRFDVYHSVTKFITICDSITDLSELLCFSLEKNDKSYISLIIDIYPTDYIRPDPYAARVIFEKKKSGEKLNKQEKNVLLSQLLIDLIIRMKNTKDITVFISSDAPSPASFELVKYLAKRKIFEGEVALSVGKGTDLGAFAQVAVEVYPTIWLRPFLDIETKKLDEKVLKEMLYVYPSGAFLTGF